MHSLTVYRIRDVLGDDVPAVFDNVLEAEILGNCETHDYSDDDLTARAYIPPIYPQHPRWAHFVQSGFPDADIGLGAANQALIVASVRRYSHQRLFAICFGHARYMIRSELIEPAFGRRVALNLLYEQPDEGAETDQGRIRQVDARTIEANVRRARVQRSRDTTFETFGVDPQRDLLDRIVGVPRDVHHFGRRISGGNSIHLDVDIGFDGLGPLLRRLLVAYGRTVYRDHFAWVDRVRAVQDPILLERLRDRTVELVVNGADNLDLAPPEIVDWDRIATFTYEIGDKEDHDDLRLEDYLAAVETSRVQELDYGRLRAHRVTARDGDGAFVSRWSISRSLFGEFELESAYYVLDDGHYFAVAADYVDELNDFIAGIAAPAIALPQTAAGTLEDVYNASVVMAGADRLLLDKKTIQVAPRTTRIEICDVMTAAGELVHVKRKLGSSDLSHLFGQGYVSAETLHAGPDLRAAARAKIDEEAQAQQRDAAMFCGLVDEPFSPQDLTVVYAVLADWQGKQPRDRLPFFSKVNLRHHADQLGRMGFKLAFAAVEAP